MNLNKTIEIPTNKLADQSSKKKLKLVLKKRIKNHDFIEMGRDKEKHHPFHCLGLFFKTSF